MAALSPRQRQALDRAGCEIRCDDLTRRLYATDASIYQVLPRAVAFPRNPAEVCVALATAAETGLPVIPRGAGTGLAGGALGEGLVIDLSPHHRQVSSLDPAARTVRVGAGVVLDQLNATARPHGLWFGPDVATSSRATIGGMVANNSSGAHAPVYGTTVEHVRALEVVLADGTVATVGRDHRDLAELRGWTDQLLSRHAAAIGERLPAGLSKRWPGYGLDLALQRPGDLTRIIAGSEGTLAVVTAAELQLVPLPAVRGLAVLYFASVIEAMTAMVELGDLQPAAIEHIDQPVFEQTRGQRAFSTARSLLGLDQKPAYSLLLVEFFGSGEKEVRERLAAVAGRKLGLRAPLITTEERQQNLVWSVRKAGLSLVTACAGPAKTTTCIEDVCVSPEQLPAYVASLQELLAAAGLEASFYGHAASGQLHVRPRLDLHTAEGVTALRRITEEVSELCRRHHGSIAAEHGVGICRTELLPPHLGDEILQVTARIKQAFDPRGLLNPGKIVDIGRFRIDRDLRQGAGRKIEVPFSELLGHVDRDGSLVGNLEQCNGCGGCRKDTPTMCPTFIATGEEELSTRGRANTIRAALESSFPSAAAPGPFSNELDQVLATCLSCKACKTECPSNVDLALLKTELLNARHEVTGVLPLDRLIAAADLLGRLGSACTPLANALIAWRPLRRLLGLLLGLDPDRPLPRFAGQRFDRWFHRRPAWAMPGERGRVILWDDTWVRYHEPQVGIAAVQVLEAAGYRLELVRGRRCCGRPAASRGLLNQVRELGEHNLRLLLHQGDDDTPIVFLEPSCYAMFVDEYRQLELPGADRVASRCLLVEQLLTELLQQQPGALHWLGGSCHVAVHAHCHQRALTDAAVVVDLVQQIDGASAELLDSGCCGMAGAFGMLQANRQLSRQVAQPLLRLIAQLPQGTQIVAAGTSCRQQLSHLAGVLPLHPVELLAAHLAPAPSEH